MDAQKGQNGIAYDNSLPGPPTLAKRVLDFGQVKQGGKKTLQQVVANTTPQPMIWLGHTGKAKWLTLEPDHGVLRPGERQSIRVTADTRTLGIGEHCFTLSFSSEGDETSLRKDAISIVKVEESSMSQQNSAPLPLQTGLHLGWLTPQSTGTMGLVINNPDTHAIEWDIQIGSNAPGMGSRVHFDNLDNPANAQENFPIGQYNGIIVTPSQGTLNPGASTTVYVTANTNHAQVQSNYAYATNLTLTSRVSGMANAPAISVQVPVSFHVGIHPYDDGGPKIPTGLPPAPHTSFTIPAGQQQGSTTLTFTNDEPQKVYWTLKPDAGADWLQVNPSSGSYDQNGQASVDLTASRANLQPGPHTTNLHLLMSYNANMDPINEIAQPFPVTVMVE